MSARRRKRPTPVWPRWRASAPGPRAVAPRGSVEVAALGVAMPRAGTTRSAWPDTWRSAGSTRSVVSGSARSAWAVVSRTTWSARSARCGSAGAALAVEIALWLPARSGRCAMVAARVGWWRPGSGARRSGTHTQRRGSKSAGDGSPRHQLLQIHCPSPAYLCIQRTFPPTYRTLDSSPMNRLREASGKLLDAYSLGASELEIAAFAQLEPLRLSCMSPGCGEHPAQQATAITAAASWFILDATLERFRWILLTRWQR